MDNKVFFLVSLILLAAGIFTLWLAIKCKEPDRLTIAITQLQCTQDVNIDDVTKRACQEIHGTPECNFNPEDGEAITNILKRTVDDCVIKTLKDAKMCVGNYEGI